MKLLCKKGEKLSDFVIIFLVNLYKSVSKIKRKDCYSHIFQKAIMQPKKKRKKIWYYILFKINNKKSCL